MGNIFCGETQQEQTKLPAFTPEVGPNEYHAHNGPNHHAIDNPNLPLDSTTATAAINATSTTSTSNLSHDPNSHANAHQQNNHKGLVQATARAMVPLRTAREYYDQGFAAALSRYLEQTTSFAESVPMRFPGPPSSEERRSIESLLLDPPHIESPNAVEEDVEHYLETIIPQKERLFANVGPMVENLL